MKETVGWLFLKPNPKWRSTTKVVTFAWLFATGYPAFHLYGAMSERNPPLPLYTQYAWVFILAWGVSTTVVLQIFAIITRLWDRIDALENEVASLRTGRPNNPS
jgi:hypothetical protein